MPGQEFAGTSAGGVACALARSVESVWESDASASI